MLGGVIIFFGTLVTDARILVTNKSIHITETGGVIIGIANLIIEDRTHITIVAGLITVSEIHVIKLAGIITKLAGIITDVADIITELADFVTELADFISNEMVYISMHRHMKM